MRLRAGRGSSLLIRSLMMGSASPKSRSRLPAVQAVSLLQHLTYIINGPLAGQGQTGSLPPPAPIDIMTVASFPLVFQIRGIAVGAKCGQLDGEHF